MMAEACMISKAHFRTDIEFIDRVGSALLVYIVVHCIRLIHRKSK